jgi:DNA mismatch repair protein MutS2
MRFDSAALSPLYRIVMGVPGESHALDIASRNGLPPALVASARAYLGENHSDVSTLIAGLKQKQEQLDKELAEYATETARLAEEGRKIALESLQIKQKKAELAESGLISLKELLGYGRKTLENLVRELKEGEISREKTLKVKKFLHDFEVSVKTAEEYEAKSVEDLNLSKLGGEKRADVPLGVGVEVSIGDRGQRGVIVRQEKSGVFLVETGSVKLTFPADVLSPLVHAHKAPKPVVLTEFVTENEALVEVNLLGMRLEDALATMRRQLDGAILSGLARFSVVHGKGDGILRQGVHEFLKNEACVVEFHFSRPELGGTGRTEVVLNV